MTSVQSYHRRRELAEEAMAARATSSVARIVHSKLAALHCASATQDAEAVAHVVGGGSPLRSGDL